MNAATTKRPGRSCEMEIHSVVEGRLRVGPLGRAEAEAFGAGLRRALMREVAGACVSAVRIAGASHEFGRLEGVCEDVVELVENLRAVRVAMAAAGPATASVAVDGRGALTVGDLARAAGLTAANPDFVIATVNEGGRLEMTVELARGRGYEGVERIQGRRAGWIEIDRDYSPVERVAMGVEGEGSEAELWLEVVTNGTVGPAEAVAEAARRLESKAGAGDAAAGLCRSVAAAARAAARRPAEPSPRPEPRTRQLAGGPTDFAVGDLTGPQKQSYERFVQLSCAPADRKAQGLEGLLRGVGALRLAGGEELTCAGYELGQAEASPRECVRLGRTYGGALRVSLRRSSDGGVATVEVCRLPLMTDRGTFIVAGEEKVVLGQLQAEQDTLYNDLTTRRLLLVGEQLAAALAGPLAEDAAAMGEAASPAEVALPRFARAAAEFFARGRFIRRAETANPLALVCQLRRVVQCGLHRPPGYEARVAHPNHFGRLCLLETPEGDKIGLNLGLSILAGVDGEGRLVTPYRRVDSGEVERLTPADEAGATIADVSFDEGYAARYGGGMLAKRGDDIVRIEPREAQYVPVHSAQAFGASASLIPLVAHDDANRALMGANMQKQAVGLIRPEAPLVRAGLEGRIVDDSRLSVKAEAAGVVARADAGEIVVAEAGGGRRSYPLTGVAGSSHGTWLRQRPRVRPGDSVVAGETIADGPATDGGVLALGRTVLVGYLPWEGYNFEDSIVISDRLVRRGVFTSVKVQEFVATVGAGGEDERLGAEHLPAEEAARLSPGGVAAEGAMVAGGEVLVALSARAGEGRRRDTSLRMPVGQRGTVVRVEHVAASEGEAAEVGAGERVRVTVAVRRRLKVGDKLANRHGAKGTVGRIVPADEMPVLPDGRSLDIILGPLGVPSRMNIGQLLETHLGLAAHALNCTVVAPPFHGPSADDIAAMLVEAGLPAGGMLPLRDGRTGRPLDHETTVGYQYVMKLVHMVDDRCQARSVGEYSPATQQPVGGRRLGGGQRVGVMETWALQAHGAARTLRDLLTIQSDDVAARGEAHEAMLAGRDTPEPTVPHSVRRLVPQLRGLCLDLRLLRADGRAVDVFQDGARTADAETAAIEFASPETVREWSAGELAELPGDEDGPTTRHIELAAAVRHPWRASAGEAGDVPDIAALPVLPRSLRGGAGLDGAYQAVLAANEAVRSGGATGEAVAALQAAVDRLIGSPTTGGGLTRLLYGKAGWVTAAMSGKTVDYSARSVASPGCDLRYDECGLPVGIAKVLFEPMVLGELVRAGRAADLDDARRMLDEEDSAALEVLRRVAAERFVLLHRAPALHRLSVQAFRPLITDESVLRVHPLTLRSFNADFDGDEMDVYLPVSAAAQAEAAGRMRSSMCQLAPANGSYMNFPSQDMVFGCYYATLSAPGAEAAAEFGTTDEVAAAFERGEVGVHETIALGRDAAARRTTVGRALFNRLLPGEIGWVDEPTTNGLLRGLMTECWHKLGPAAAARLGDDLMRFGFHHATLSGLSMGMDVLRQYSRLGERLAEAWRAVAGIEQRRSAGEMSEEEEAGAVLRHWWRASEEMADEALAELAGDRGGLNPFHLMLASGARGNRQQAKQLLLMRGLLTLPTGRIVPTPVTASFLRGHSPLEYLAASFGARKGLADTALKSADAGSLFKRIMSAVQDVVIVEDDCRCRGGLVKRAVREGDRQVVSLAERIVGRTAAEDVPLPAAAGPVVRRGEVIGRDAAERIAAAGVERVAVRSPLTCESGSGICAKCYGLDLGTWQPPARGEAVGVLAAQSIGEPMTQLTMRTFHPAALAIETRSGQARQRESIIGGLPRLERLFDAGATPGREDADERRRLDEMLREAGPTATGEHLMVEVHKVYRLQGVRIDDRHLEVVVREMVSRLRVTDVGATALAAGEMVSAAQFEAANSAAMARPASAEPAIVGVAEAGAATADFLAAATAHGGVPALARAAARKQSVALRGIRNRMVAGASVR